MPAIFSTFATMLTSFQNDIQTNVLGKVAKTTLYPLAATALALALIVGSVQGWAGVEQWWSSLASWSQPVAVVLGVVILVFVAYALASLQSVVADIFKGHVNFPLLTDRLLDWHRDEWDDRHKGYERWAALWAAIDDVLAQVAIVAPPSVRVAARPLTAGEVLTPDAVRAQPVKQDRPQWFTATGVLGRVLLQPLIAGAELTRDVLLPPDGDLPFDSYVNVPLTLSAQQFPAPLVPGARVRLYQYGPNTTPGSIGETAVELPTQPAVVLTMQPLAADQAGAAEKTLFTLAVAPDDVQTVLRQSDAASTASLVLVQEVAKQPDHASDSSNEMHQTRFVVSEQLAKEWQAKQPPVSVTDKVGLVLVAQRTDRHYVMRPRIATGTVHVLSGQLFLDLRGDQQNEGPPLWMVTALVQDNEAYVNSFCARCKEWATSDFLEKVRRLTDQELSNDSYYCPELVRVALTGLALLKVLPSDGKAEQQRTRVTKSLRSLLRPLQEARQIVDDRRNEAHQFFRLYYPSHYTEIAPTRIGNILRSVDAYVEDVYGLDAGLVLPRLQVVLGDTLSDDLSSPANALALLEWSCLGALAVDFGGGALAAVQRHWLLALGIWVIASLLATLLYQATIPAALRYAEQLRVTFDLKRGQLLTALGITPTAPITGQAEKDLWQSITHWLEYGRLADSLPYTIKTDATAGSDPSGSKAT